MKQNKWLQITIYITTILLQIFGFIYLVSHSKQSFDTKIITPLLLKYGMTIAGILALAGLIYGGCYIKKYRTSWIKYAEINIFFPLMKGFGINTIFHVTNFLILGVINMYSKEFSKELTYISSKLIIMSALNTGALFFIMLIYSAILPPNHKSHLDKLY